MLARSVCSGSEAACQAGGQKCNQFHPFAHDLHSRKFVMAFGLDIRRIFAPAANKIRPETFAVGTKKLNAEQLHRFVVV